MRTFVLPLAFAATAGLIPAQQQFLELARMKLPTDTDASRDVDAGDVDGDGDIDIVIANNGQNRIYINDGLGVFTDETSTRFPNRTVNSREVLLVDMDGDNDLDLWVANNRQNRLMLNDGLGVFRIAPLPAQRVFSEDVAVGDVDGDGDLDVYWAEQGTGAIASQNHLWLNDGSLGFTDVTATNLPAVLDASDAVAMGDLDGDGDLDVFVANGSAVGQDRLYINDGSGVFSDATSLIPAGRSPTFGVLLEDLDQDLDLEILTVGDNGAIQLLRNDGNLNFVDVSGGFQSSGGTLFDLDCADLDADGDLDLLICEFFGGTNRIYLNQGALQFTLAPSTRSSQEAQDSSAVVLFDADGDLDLDAVVSNDATQNRLEFNLHRQIHTPMAPVHGQNYQVDFYAQSGFITAPQPLLVWVAFFRVVPPLTVPPWGTLHILPQSGVSLPTLNVQPPNGLLTLNLPLIPDPGLIGLPIFIQGGVVHTNSPLDWRFTNLVADRIQ